ncbi:MAG: hypothetical protein LUG95_04055 [Clostridiales bacterium]|nr:hypothetical protein [Clostridiales bacterium]
MLYAELVDYENEPAFIYGARRWDDYVEGKIVAVLIPPKAKEGEKQLKKIWIVAPAI